MKIIELKSENVKRIKAVEIKPSSNMVILEGKNEQGKTSILDSIAYTLGGTKLIPEKPIRDGEESAEVFIDIGDYKITRKWKLGGKSTVKLETKDGMGLKSPQMILDALVGDLAFDPMSFCQKKKEERVKILKDIAKLDFTDMETEYKEKYEERTLVNINQIECLIIETIYIFRDMEMIFMIIYFQK